MAALFSRKRTTPPSPPTITLESSVEIDEIDRQVKSDGSVWIGNRSRLRYIEVDELTLDAIDTLRSQPTIAAAEKDFERRHGESFDLVALVVTLHAAGLVTKLDGRPTARQTRRHVFLERVPSRWFAWMHSPLVGILLLGFLALVVVLYAHDYANRPRAVDAGVNPDHPLASIVFFIAGLLAVTYLHELGHYFAAKSYGVRASIRVTSRFLVLILQTDVTGAALLPLGQRLVVILAGVCTNLLLGGTAYLICNLGVAGMVHLTTSQIHWLRAFAYLNTVPIMFQLLVVARTDLYFLLAALLDEPNLMADSTKYLRWRVKRAWRLTTGRGRLSSCPHCSARTIAGDPFCTRCGGGLRVRNPNKYPFKYRTRHKLVFGASVIMLSLYPSLNFLLQIFNRLGKDYFNAATNLYRSGLANGDATFVIAAGILIAFGALQILLLAGSIGRKLRPLWRIVRRAANRRLARAGQLGGKRPA